MKTLNRKFHKCFQKVRIKNGTPTFKGNKAIQTFLDIESTVTNILKRVTCTVSRQLLTTFLRKTEKDFEVYIYQVNNEVKDIINSLELANGQFNRLGFWKLRNKLCPRRQDPPMAKRDAKGNIITSPEALKQLYIESYVARLKHRDIKAEFVDIFHLKTELWETRMQTLSNMKNS